jgi:hypothetical protein
MILMRRWQDALSELTRKNVWDWYTGTAYNRLMPGGSIVVINHRMHEDDLCGRLCWPSRRPAAIDGKWSSFPRLTKPARRCGPMLTRLKRLSGSGRTRRRGFGPRSTSSGRRPEEGDYFKAEWLRPYEKAPPLDTLRVYGGSDYAVTADGGDYTVHAVVGIDPEGRMYLLDLWRKQAAPMSGSKPSAIS